MRPLILSICVVLIPILLISLLTAGTALQRKNANHLLSQKSKKVKENELHNVKDTVKFDSANSVAEVSKCKVK